MPFHSTVTVPLLLNGKTVEVAIQPQEGDSRLTWGDQSETVASLHLLTPDSGVLVWQGRHFPCYWLQTREKTLERTLLWIQGRTVVIEVPRQGRDRSVALSQSGEILAPMPGTIRRVLVAVGEAVEAQQPLLVMESMKMEMTLSAPSSGRVALLSAVVDQRVQMAELLVRLEALDKES
jgi:biotin carboxyl carrier protein